MTKWSPKHLGNLPRGKKKKNTTFKIQVCLTPKLHEAPGPSGSGHSLSARKKCRVGHQMVESQVGVRLGLLQGGTLGVLNSLGLLTRFSDQTRQFQ